MSGIYLVAALALALVMPAKAQQLNQPKTIKLHNKGEPLGTVTISDGKAYYRDKHGVHYATTVRNPDGTLTSFDTNGNVIKPVPLPE